MTLFFTAADECWLDICGGSPIVAQLTHDGGPKLRVRVEALKAIARVRLREYGGHNCELGPTRHPVTSPRRVQVANERLQVGLVHARTIVTVEVDDATL